MLRGAIGGTMIAHGRTLDGTAGWFDSIGFLGAASVALSTLGSGRYSVGRVLGVDRVATPRNRALVTAGLGLAGAAAQLTACWRRPS